TLSPAACSTLTFADWVVPDSNGTCFDVTFRTLLAIDTNPSNDTMSTVSCASCPPALRDVGVISIDGPPDTVYADSTVPVMVTVTNYGDSAETFSVSITIDGFSDTSLVSSLAPAGTLQVSFASWIAPSTCDTSYTATVTTLLGVDMNPANDTLSKGIFARCAVGVFEDPISDIPHRFALLQSRPNPFSISTEIRYQLPAEADVSLTIYDTAGRLVRSLAKGAEEAGFKRVLWDGRDDQGKTVNSGVYFYKLQVDTGSKTGDFTKTKKLILLR
ncbi:T9SS type A sorting domain-containing protein, partial [candidate division TA06 bacterium]|nr:T9SS type A sorting domain-containing protein [candidate division TA06 bacterium]